MIKDYENMLCCDMSIFDVEKKCSKREKKIKKVICSRKKKIERKFTYTK